MSFLFKSKKQREREARKQRRRAFRDAENQISDVRLRIKKLEQEIKQQWKTAKEAMASGDIETAERHLIGYRTQMGLVLKQEQKRWVFEQYLHKLENAETDTAFTQTLDNINKVMDIDPDRVENVFDTAEDLLGEQMEVDTFWTRLHDKELNQKEEFGEDLMPSLDGLRDKLSLEAGSPESSGESELEDRIQKGHERLNRILEDS